jgi:hypothetical protein
MLATTEEHNSSTTSYSGVAGTLVKALDSFLWKQIRQDGKPFGFSHEKPFDLLFSMRRSIPISQDASECLRLLHRVLALVRSVLQLHKDGM